MSPPFLKDWIQARREHPGGLSFVFSRWRIQHGSALQDFERALAVQYLLMRLNEPALTVTILRPSWTA
jgi:hypothetical protein